MAKPEAHARFGLCCFMALLFPVNHFPDHDPLCAGADVVLAAEPFRRIGGFQAFGDAFGGGQLGDCGFKLLPCRAVDVKEMFRQFSGEDEGGEGAVALLFEIALAHPSVLADTALGLRVHDQIGDLDIADRCISDVHVLHLLNECNAPGAGYGFAGSKPGFRARSVGSALRTR